MDPQKGAYGQYDANLHHASANANLDFSSGYAGDVIGLDLAAFGALELSNSGPAAPNEIGFSNARTRWDEDWSGDESGLSLYKAAIKAKWQDNWLRAGYLQPSGQTLLAPHWSFLPGTYRGVEAGTVFDFSDAGALSVSWMWTDEYKAPWYRDMYNFRKADGVTGDSVAAILCTDEILVDVIRNLPSSQGYCDSKGLYSARKAIMQHYQARDMRDVTVEDIYIGNGVSELIVQAMQALLNSGDEMLVPAPDYPLWTAAVSLSSGKAVHYLCDESAGWFPDLDDIRSKITPRTRGIVIINPNNPTGAVYSKELLLEIVEIARQHNLIIFADEIYDKILYDEAQHHSIAALAPDLLTVTFNGLSKTYRVAGFRQGWMVLNGPKKHAKGYIEGLEMLASMRLCANVPAQHAIQTALGGYQS
uniref:Aminotransferase class I/classII large domain-containing protein n=1 Tax=Acyrthosiphon pisum TaxID=7029 RepID=A0A8R2JVP3_ACYPI